MSETSMRESIASLPVGSSYSKTRRWGLEAVVDKDMVTNELAMMKNTLNAAMRRAMAETGRRFTLETGSMVTRSGALLLVAAVTRVE